MAESGKLSSSASRMRTVWQSLLNLELSDVLIDLFPNWRKYRHIQRLEKAFELLETPWVLSLPDGRHELDGGLVIAMPQAYATKPASEGRWESHRRYIDIQYVVSGTEVMGWAPVTSLVPETSFDAVADVGFYTGQGDMLTVRQGMFALFLPQDGHMPCLRAGDQSEQVRKIVVKVAVE